MQIKSITWALAFLAIAGVLAGAHYIEGNYWRNRLLAERPDTAKSQGADIRSILPPDTFHLPAVHVPPKNPVQRQIDPSTLKLASQTDSLRAVIEDLLLPVRAELTTSQGETIEVTYDPQTDNFTVIPTSVVVIRPTETLISHNIPEIPAITRDVWLSFNALNAQGAAILGTLGYKQVGFTVGLIQDKLAWGVGVHFQL